MSLVEKLEGVVFHWESITPEQWKYITDLASIPFSISFWVIILVMILCRPRNHVDRAALVWVITLAAVASRHTISAVFDLYLNETPWAAAFFVLATLATIGFAVVVAIYWGGFAVRGWRRRRHGE